MKKLGLFLSVIAVAFALVACGGSTSEIQEYLDENIDNLTLIFDSLGLGDFELEAVGNDQIVATFELDDDTYDMMQGILAIGSFGSVAEAVEVFIVDMHTVHMRALAAAIEVESELEQVMIRIIVNHDGDELANLTFENE